MSEPLELLAEAATISSRRRKRGRLNSTHEAPQLMVVPIDMSNQGIQRMLQINKVRFGLDEQHSVLYVFFEKDKKRRSAKTGRFQAHEEEYPYLGSSTEELAQHIATQNISDIGTLAAMYPAAFWNAVYLLGKDLDKISQELCFN